MNLPVSPRLQKLIDDRLAGGKYRSTEDVIAAAVTNLSQQEALADLSAQEMELVYPGIRQKITEGLASLRAGDIVDGDAFFDELEREDHAS